MFSSLSQVMTLADGYLNIGRAGHHGLVITPEDNYAWENIYLMWRTLEEVLDPFLVWVDWNYMMTSFILQECRSLDKRKACVFLC